jgi:probable addiction module antidote protein
MRTIKLRPWESTEHLNSEDDQTHYLNACLEVGDPALITHALSVIARVRGMTQLARDMEDSGAGSPAFATVLRGVEALGFRLHVELDRR